MAMSTSPKDCPICDEEYDEKVRCPRILSCSHTLCTDCIENLIKNNKNQCPFCRSSFSVTNSKDIIINHTALDLINHYRQKNSGPTSLLDKMKNMILEALETTGNQEKSFQEAKQRTEEIIEKINKFENLIEQENERLLSECIPKIQNMISENRNVLADLKLTKAELKIQLQDLRRKEETLHILKQNINSCPTDTFIDICKVLEDVDKFNASVNNEITAIQEYFSKEEDSLNTEKKNTMKLKQKIDSVLDLLNTTEKREEYTFPFSDMDVGAILGKPEDSKDKKNEALLLPEEESHHDLLRRGTRGITRCGRGRGVGFGSVRGVGFGSVRGGRGRFFELRASRGRRGSRGYFRRYYKVPTQEAQD